MADPCDGQSRTVLHGLGFSRLQLCSTHWHASRKRGGRNGTNMQDPTDNYECCRLTFLRCPCACACALLSVGWSRQEVPDFRLSTRTFHIVDPAASYLNPLTWPKRIVQFWYWHMNYHIEHHMYAAVVSFPARVRVYCKKTIMAHVNGVTCRACSVLAVLISVPGAALL